MANLDHLVGPQDMIDASPKTTVAALNGPALGGGAEVSLACRGCPGAFHRARGVVSLCWLVDFIVDFPIENGDFP